MTTRVIILSILLSSSVFCQTSQRSDSVAVLTVVTDPPGADVFIDSSYLGKSPLRSISIVPGSHRLRAFSPSMFAWNATLREELLEAAPGEVLDKRMMLERTLSIQTDPPGGSVLLDGKSLGVTPLYTRNAASLAGSLMIQKSGYDSVIVPVGDIRGGFLKLRLKPANSSLSAPFFGDVRGPQSVATDHWPTYLAGVVMIVSGVTSAYLKDQANGEFDRYLLTKDQASLSATRRLDRGAAVSLAISQISFVVLSYLLLGE